MSTANSAATTPNPAASAAPSAPATGSSGDKVVVGIKVSWEIKLMVIVTVFAIIKGISTYAMSTMFLWVARLFYLATHGFFVYIYFYTNYRISKSTTRSNEEKVAAKSDCQKVIRSIGTRAVIMGLVHLRTGMVPPMFVTPIMAFLSLIENDFFFQVVYSKYPAVFDLLFT